MPMSALEKQMREDRKETIVRIHDCLEELKGLTRQKLMLDKYLGDDGGETDLTVQTVSVQMQQAAPSTPPAPRTRRPYTRKPKEQKSQDAPPIESHYCSDCKKNVNVHMETVKGQVVTKCAKCGGLQVEKLS